MAELPHWNLDSIYPSCESIEFRNDLESLIAKSEELETAVDDRMPILTILEKNNEARSLLVNLSAYTGALLSTDTSSSIYMKANGDVENAGVIYSSAEEKMVHGLYQRRDEFSRPELSDYSYYLDCLKTQAEHQMSLEEENLASDLARSGSSSWERLQASITSSSSDGDKTLIELRGMATDGDRSVRKIAFERELKVLEEHGTALAASLNGVKGTVLTLERRRHWDDPVDSSLFSSRITRKALDSLIASLEEALPMFRHYLGIKASLLGIGKMDFFDLFAPVGHSGRKYSFEEARDIVVSSYASFSRDMGEFAENAFRSGWIDAEPRKGKVGGAYDTAFPLAKESRVLCNFDYSYDSVATIAHELGHAYHDSIVKDIPMVLSEYPMTLAETASIFGESVVFQNVLAGASHEEALPIIEQFVQSCCQVCVDILSRFYFERAAFAKRREGEIGADEYCAMMLDAQERTYGDGLGIKHPYMWAVKSHYYSADFSFYNYPYAFGQLFALSLYSMKDSDPGFPSSYRRMLSMTGRASANEVASSMGCDIEDRAFWKRGLDMIGVYIKRLEEWL
ncbi:MAG: M3 family oligoendopeptidase [Candidatus Ornithospirochaeta sp.]|nr:M3 family oligoendopeptidase [Candidatus Ornithospirochaeta sp.]